MNHFEEKENRKSKANIPTIDLIFVFIFVLLFLIVSADFYIEEADFLFRQTDFGPSIFGILSSVLIPYYFIIWGGLKAKENFKIKGGRKKVILKAFRFIGLTESSSRDILYILLGILAGFLVNFLTLFAFSVLLNGRLQISGWPGSYMILQNILVAPMFEELIYRGIYLSVFLRVLGKNYVSAILGLLLSSFVFGWTHPIQPIVKTFGGFVLGCIYLFKWKKNIIASFSTHVSMNVVGTFLIVVF